MTTIFNGKPIVPKRDPVDGACVDCGRHVPAEQVARVLRRASVTQPARVVCNDCSARLHAAKRPAPIVVQRAMPRPPISGPED
jgi:DNA-directed RNA polymerase subunit RPC12/RpoP